MQSSSSTPKYCQASNCLPSCDFSKIHAVGVADSADFILNENISYTC